MSDLKYWEEKIKEKRKKTDFRDFVREICSWFPLVFYKNNGSISRFPNTNRAKIVPANTFEKNRDDLLKSPIIYDSNIPFFQQFSSLFLQVEHPSFLQYGTNENSDYCDAPMNAKNAYLSSVIALGGENILYSLVTRSNVVNCFNSVYVLENCENIYFCIGIISSFNIFYSKYIRNSNNIRFSLNLNGCSECIFCREIENQSYCINNVQYSKEEYMKRKSSILLNKSDFYMYYLKILEFPGKNFGSTNVTGSFLLDSENIEKGVYSLNLKNGRNALFTGAVVGNQNIFDSCMCGAGGGEDLFAVLHCPGGTSNLYCVAHCVLGCVSTYYSYNLESCSFCIGCIGLKNKSFCILNKQYSKEEWLELADRIFTQMDKDGTLGDFFPGNLNPFYFNDTMAYLIDDSFTKEEVEKENYLWRNENIKVDIPENAEVINSKDLNKFQNFDLDGNWQINPEILKKVIQDENGNIYKIVKMEYDFLVKYALPLPEIHWLDRIKLGFKF